MSGSGASAADAVSRPLLIVVFAAVVMTVFVIVLVTHGNSEGSGVSALHGILTAIARADPNGVVDGEDVDLPVASEPGVSRLSYG